jgi:hypothetical protein
MTNLHSQDAMLADALATLTNEAEAPAPEAPRSTRRTVIIPEVEAPESGYRVILGNSNYGLDVQAPSRGEAVLRALDFAKNSDNPNLRNASAHVFMWTYTVTDSEGRTVRGVEMREEVQAARIARSNARAIARNAG